MISNQKYKLMGVILLFLIGCSTVKKNEEDIEFKNFMLPKKVENATVGDYRNFLDFKEEQTKLSLIKNKFIKIDKVYMYNRSEDSFSFTVFSSDGKIHIATAHLGEYLELNSKIVKIIKPIPLRCIGSFQLKNDTIKVLRYEKTPFREWSENDVGYIKNDTVVYTETYIAKDLTYEKKLLATTYKTNFRFGYQPTLNANFYKDAFSGYYEINGFFEVK